MNNEHTFDLSMTRIENGLRHFYMLRPEIKDRILSAEELSEYHKWMQSFYTDSDALALSMFRDYVRGSELDSSLSRKMESALEEGKLNLFLDSNVGHYAHSREENHLAADQDITAGRMLRYMPAHWHSNEYFELYYAVGSGSEIHFEDETLHLNAGSVVIVAPGIVYATPCFADDALLVSYRIRTSTFERVFWQQLPPDSLLLSFFRRALDGSNSTAYLHFETDADVMINELLAEIYDESQARMPYRAQMLNVLMSTFFVKLLRSYEGSARLPRSGGLFWKHEFSAIFSYIQSNYTTATINEVAERFHYSKRQISRIVQNCTGMSYADLVLKMRMERAAKLLTQSGRGITEIAEGLGYAHSSSFFRAFSSYYHCTPSEYIAANVPGRFITKSV